MANDDMSMRHASKNRKYFGFDVADLAERDSLFTAEEITQQPRAWREAQSLVDATRDEIDAWLLPKLELPQVRVYFCGAGTSAFIGDTVAAWLRSTYASDNPIVFESVSTTDFVADPSPYANHDLPTIMVSFARSGDSPESVASVQLADQVLSECYHLIFTCNPKGRLAMYAKDDPNTLCLMMPEGTNDRGFAMTSSYSSMLVSCAAVFVPEPRQLEQAARLAETLIDEQLPGIASLAQIPFERIVVLGSGILFGTAREATLKCMELAAGHLVGISDTPLGFRHGPKIVVSANTLVVQMVSGDSYTRRYDHDLLSELRSDEQAAAIVELSPEFLFPGIDVTLDDIWLSLLYIVYCQMLAFMKSYTLGISVDSPCPSGEVNRVVQGVTIHPYKD